MAVQQFCLKWNNHQPNFISVFTSLLNSEALVDVTLSAEGGRLRAHKVVLCACSPYFQSIFTETPAKHPVVILKDVSHSDLKALVHFMYYGEVNVSQDQLPQILSAAKMLKIKGLADMSEPSGNNGNVNNNERANLLTPDDSSWHSDAQLYRDMSPHRPYSPNNRRKRIRNKHSRSPSQERNTNPPTDQNISNRSQPEPVNFSNAPPGNSFCSKSRPPNQQPNTYNTSKDSFDENGSIDGNLIIDEQNECNITKVTNSVTDPPSISSAPHQGSQWSGMDGNYQRYSTALFHPDNSHNVPPFNDNPFHSPDMTFGMQDMLNPYEYPTSSQNLSQNSETTRASPGPSCSNPNTPQDNQLSPAPKRRRTSNPQSGHNFQQALEAVRVGGIGFCKAAKMFGVNNRTLWLEYKKKGYPNNRPSIKSRIKQEQSSPPPPDESTGNLPDQQLTLLCPPHPVSMMGFIDLRPVDFTSGIQNSNHPRYVDDPMNLHNSPLNLHGINFNSLQ